MKFRLELWIDHNVTCPWLCKCKTSIILLFIYCLPDSHRSKTIQKICIGVTHTASRGVQPSTLKNWPLSGSCNSWSCVISISTELHESYLVKHPPMGFKYHHSLQFIQCLDLYPHNEVRAKGLQRGNQGPPNPVWNWRTLRWGRKYKVGRKHRSAYLMASFSFTQGNPPGPQFYHLQNGLCFTEVRLVPT